MFKEFLLCLVCLIALLFFVDKTHAHPDGATPFWYPSSYVYGFVKGCSESIEQARPPFIEQLWPDQVRSVCGCVIDALRHSLTFVETINSDNESQAGMQLIVNATMPICVNQELAKKIEGNQ